MIGRVKALPEDYRFVYEKIQKYMWSFAAAKYELPKPFHILVKLRLPQGFLYALHSSFVSYQADSARFSVEPSDEQRSESSIPTGMIKVLVICRQKKP